MDRWIVSRLNTLIAVRGRRAGRLRRHAGRARAPGLRHGRPLQLVRQALAQALLAPRDERRQGGGLLDAVRGAGHHLQSCWRLSCPSWPRRSTATWCCRSTRAPRRASTCATTRRATGRSIDGDLEAAMDAVVRCVTLVRAARNRAKIKVKQPLPAARIKLGAKIGPGPARVAPPSPQGRGQRQGGGGGEATSRST